MINLQIKTPVWTGDIDMRSGLLQSTGIIGSLRWWAEAILRGIGKYACDPTSDKKELKEKRCPVEDKDRKYYCSACLIFGATGMRKLFRLDMSGGENLFNGRAINIMPLGRGRGWYLGSGLKGQIRLSVIELDKVFDNSLVLLPLAISANWGGIGAKTQHGYGVVEIEDCPEVDFNKFKEAIEKVTGKERLSRLSELLYKSKLKILLRDENSNGLPNLKEMFFAKVQFEADGDDWWKSVDGVAERGQRGQRNYYEGYVNDPRMRVWVNSGSVPITPAIKNWLRYGNGTILWKSSNQNRDRKIENWLFGTVRNGKTSSKINISCAYKVKNSLWEFRIWGWIPKDGLPEGFDKDNFLNGLKQALGGSGSVTIPWNGLLGNQTKDHRLKVWREYNSSRDTVKRNESDVENYIQSLLKGEEEAK